jgi:hypothetical protein
MIVIVGLLLLSPSLSWAQAPPDTIYQVEVSMTACPAVSAFRNPRVPGIENDPSLGYGLFVRGMWHPGRLLAVGLMTGYLSIARDEIPVEGALSEEFPDPTAHLSAIPMQIAISMQNKHLEVGMGVGPYLMMSGIDNGNGVSAQGNRVEFGVTLFGFYDFPLTDRMTIGPELRVLYLGYRGILSLMPSLSFRTDVLRY